MTWANTNHRDEDTMDSKYIKKIMSNLKCGVCGQHYKSGNISVLGYQSDVWFLNVSCPSCNSMALIAATLKKEKQSPSITDLTKAEISRLCDAEAITSDDIIDIYSYLQEFDGDFTKLFGNN
jgi:transcription elongation factor Elf1